MEYPKVVYAIQHRTTGRIYIGITNALENRYKSHLSLLKHNKHTSPLMQKEYNEYGGLYDVFILDEVRDYSERCKEYEWMRRYHTQDERYGYNSQDRGRCEKKSFPLKSGFPKMPIY